MKFLFMINLIQIFQTAHDNLKILIFNEDLISMKD